MDHLTLRALFDYLCAHFEENPESVPFVFKHGLDLETPQGSMMVFVFDKITVVCRFREAAGAQSSMKAAISMDDCLGMMDDIRGAKDGFEVLFNVN